MNWDNLIGTPFKPGVDDCFELGRKFFEQNFNVKINDYARPSDWSADNLDLITRCFEREGFEKITTWTSKDLRPGDVLCLAVGSSNPNHFAIFVGDNKIIHHTYGRLSTEETYRDFWRSLTCYILRHPSVPDLRPVHPDISLLDILNARLDFSSQAQ